MAAPEDNYFLRTLLNGCFSQIAVTIVYLNPIQDGPCRGCSRMGEQKGLFPKICHMYPTMMKLGNYTLPKENPKIYKSRDTPLGFC